MFVLLFENNEFRTVHTRYFCPTVEMKHSSFMIDGRNFFDQSMKSYLRTHKNIQKIATGQENYYTTAYLIDHLYFKKYYKLTPTDLS